MNLLLRTTALVLFMLSRTPAVAAAPATMISEKSDNSTQNEVCSKTFKHNLSGLYGIPSTTNYSPTQPHVDFDVLYAKAHHGQKELEQICKNTALLTSTHAYFSGVKSEQRARQKIAHELNGEVNRITDLARATIVAEDIESLMLAYEQLNRFTKIVKTKNRFKTPARSGYRDLNLLVQLPHSNIVAEVQLHLKAIADVKSGEEHDIYEEIQSIERAAASQSRQLNEIEVARIHHLRNQSRSLYQDAWQPYITTNLIAA